MEQIEMQSRKKHGLLSFLLFIVGLVSIACGILVIIGVVHLQPEDLISSFSQVRESILTYFNVHLNSGVPISDSAMAINAGITVGSFIIAGLILIAISSIFKNTVMIEKKQDEKERQKESKAEKEPQKPKEALKTAPKVTRVPEDKPGRRVVFTCDSCYGNNDFITNDDTVRCEYCKAVATKFRGA